MTIVLRDLNKSIIPWDKERTEDEDWLPIDEVRGDVFKSVLTTNNRLSVYFLDSEEQLPRAIAALSANKHEVQHFAFAIFDATCLPEIGIEIEQTPGSLHDPDVSKWHRDLVKLNSARLLALTHLMYQKATIDRKLDQFVGKQINQAIIDQHIDPNKLSQKMREDLTKSRYKV